MKILHFDVQEIHAKNTYFLSELHNRVIPLNLTLLSLPFENRIMLRIFTKIKKNQAKVHTILLGSKDLDGL